MKQVEMLLDKEFQIFHYQKVKSVEKLDTSDTTELSVVPIIV